MGHLVQPPQTIQEFVVFRYRICIDQGSTADAFLKTSFPEAIRMEKDSILDMYQGIHNGDCDAMLEKQTRWSNLKDRKEYNPDCSLHWVGGDRIVKEVPAGFATKADSGYLCTGFIRDVLDIHMRDIVAAGFVKEARERENARTQDIDCNSYNPDLFLSVHGPNSSSGKPTNRNLVGLGNSDNITKRDHRDLKGGGGGKGVGIDSHAR